ncbi:MAG: hypothetical protein JXR37_14505 [Kiritimatiellae bacterium]|nr:hypothetical protein [Kiritimatiellia bacterium]
MSNNHDRSAAPVDHALVPRLIEAAGRFTQSFGLGRSVGQIFGAVYLSPSPMTLDDLTAALGISKGSASMGVRQLEQWGALERIWVKGDRKDYYQARDDFGKIIRKAILDTIGTKMLSAADFLDELRSELDNGAVAKDAPTDDVKFLRQRLQKLLAFQKKAKGLWESDILRLLLK